MAILDRKRAFLCFLGVLALLPVACGSVLGKNESRIVDAHPIQPTLRPEAAEPTLVPDATNVPVPAVPPAPTTVPAPAAIPVATGGDLLLPMVAPLETELLTSEPLFDIIGGRTRVDAVVTNNDTVIEPDLDVRFSLGIDLEEGSNIIEVVASVASGKQKDVVVVRAAATNIAGQTDTASLAVPVSGAKTKAGEATVSGGKYLVNTAQPNGASFRGNQVTFSVGGAEASPSGAWQQGGADIVDLTSFK